MEQQQGFTGIGQEILFAARNELYMNLPYLDAALCALPFVPGGGMTVSLARELGPKGIRVNAVAPGITETDMMKAVPKEIIDPMIAQIPLRRLGQPEDIANAFVFLASEEASYITGVVLSVDGMART